MWTYTQIYKWIKLYSSLEQYTPNSPICPNHQILTVCGVSLPYVFLQYFLVNFYWSIVTLQCWESQLYIYFMYIHVFHVFIFQDRYICFMYLYFKIYAYISSFGFFPHSGHHRALSTVQCYTYRRFSLVILYTVSIVYISQSHSSNSTHFLPTNKVLIIVLWT